MTFVFSFFFQAEDGIRDHCVTGVQTCALPIWRAAGRRRRAERRRPPPQPRLRPADAGAGAATCGERRDRFQAGGAGFIAADRQPRAPHARRRHRGPVDDDLPAPERPVSPRLPNRRIRLLLVLFVVAFLATFGRAFWLQAVQAQPLDRMAKGQHDVTVDVPAARGSILDRHGVELAIGQQAITVYANPRHIADPRATAIAAGRALHIDADKLYGKLADRSRGFVYVARKADPKRANALKALHLTGLGFYPEERRVYPQGSVGSHVLGFAGVDNHGLAGLELALDKKLAGRDGRQTVVRDGLGRTIDVLSAVSPVEGRDVRLTVDATLQANAQSVLQRAVRHWGARATSAVVLDPRTGEVLAMASEPGFDANRFS